MRGKIGVCDSIVDIIAIGDVYEESVSAKSLDHRLAVGQLVTERNVFQLFSVNWTYWHFPVTCQRALL